MLLKFVVKIVLSCFFKTSDLGYRRAAEVQEHVGALLSGSERNRVSVLVSIKSAAHEMHSIYSTRMHVVAHFSYMVDAADQEKVEASRNELHNLLDKPQLQGIPVSVDPKLFVCVCVL